MDFNFLRNGKFSYYDEERDERGCYVEHTTDSFTELFGIGEFSACWDDEDEDDFHEYEIENSEYPWNQERIKRLEEITGYSVYLCSEYIRDVGYRTCYILVGDDKIVSIQTLDFFDGFLSCYDFLKGSLADETEMARRSLSV